MEKVLYKLQKNYLMVECLSIQFKDGYPQKETGLMKKAYEDSLPKNITVVAENNDKSKDKNSDKEKSNTEKDSKSDSTKKDGSNSYSSWLGVHSGDSFGTALKDAFDKAGFIYSMSGNWISSITVDGVEYSSGEWGTDPYYGYAIYYSDGVKWVPTEEYDEGSMFAIVFDKYLFSAPENPDIYYNNYDFYYSGLSAER